MPEYEALDKIAINTRSHKLLNKLLKENPKLEEIMRYSQNETEALVGVRNWVLKELDKSPDGMKYYKSAHTDRKTFEALKWNDYAAIRILDYIDHAGKEYSDLNLRGKKAINNPIKLIWLAVYRGTGGAKPFFFEDMLELFRQFRGESEAVLPSKEKVLEWMDRHPSGLDPRIVRLREENKERIVNVIVKKIDSGEKKDKKYFFEPDMSREQKFLKVMDWWNDWRFHLRFAVRTPEELNEMMGESMDPDAMKILFDAKAMGIPFFVNPYYISLLHVRTPYFAIGADLAIKDYVMYSERLVNEFGHVVAWEKEDKVEPGKPNAAGWLLPSHHNIHRRYPEVAILIPDSMGRACGGLCASCQRMYDFQRGNLNFNLDKLKPTESWPERLKKLMAYFENDSQLRDVLVTGGDALMSTDKTLKNILDAIFEMARNKKEANKKRKKGEKYAELLRVRLGSRLLAYLPQRITPELLEVLANFKKKAAMVGVKQFVIQTHFESSMEMTPEAEDAIKRLMSSGWTVTNQFVLTAAASRRGHAAKLRKTLNDVGVMPYYTFTVKGYMENSHNFATNARAVQEQLEEKRYGLIPEKYHEEIKKFPLKAEKLAANISELRDKESLPFLATDRNVLNLPGVGKSLSFRVIGITRYGRRILEFDHDSTRVHSPIIHKMGKVIIVESKSISEYLQQLENMGEDIADYKSLYGYSMGETEPRMSVYEYPAYDFKLTGELTNLQLD
ncbi:MAG: KamA family protein [bacterium]|nr:KamA family protein [bacterium]